MKILINSFLIIALAGCTATKKTTSVIAPAPQSPVYVSNWGKMTAFLDSVVWHNAEKEIISQIGAGEYAIVKKKYDYLSIPPAMSIGYTRNLKNPKEYYERLGRLKIYKIGSFRNYSKGTDWGRLAILKVPYSGNENWDPNVKWDSVYFIIDENLVEQTKNP